MISYTGEVCLICDRKFADNDDIVVCPECGTPYHRICLKEKNSCVNSALHESGGSWMSELRERKKKEHAVRKACPECSFLNPENAEKCFNCGTGLAGKKCRIIDLTDKNIIHIMLDADADYFSMNPMEIMDKDSGITIGEMGDYAGFNKQYYMHMFRRIRRSAVKLTINFIAFIFPEYYCAFRKMYFKAALIFLLRSILCIPLYLEIIAHADPSFFSVSAEMYSDIEKLIRSASDHTFSRSTMYFSLISDLLLRTVFCLTANMVYFRYIVNKLKIFRKRIRDYVKYRKTIKTSGGINTGAVISVICLKVVFICLLLISLLRSI